MAIPRLHKEMSIFDPDSTIDAGIEDAGSKATNYLTTITGTSGISVHDAGDTSNYVNISSSGMDVVQGGTSVASFGSEARIGSQTSGNYAIVDSDSFDVYNATYGSTPIAHIGYGEGNDGSGGTSSKPYYTFGTRTSGSGIGNWSVVAGYNAIASGFASHAEGSRTTASAVGSHAEGYATTASDFDSHAEGSNTTASGIYSHTQNFYTTAGYAYQTAIGKYNDNKSTTLFEIGNGTADNARSNALEVDTSGNVTAAGRFITASAAGFIQMFGGSTAPTGWLLCNGAAVSRTDYAALFAVIGTTYGAGDGSTTFNLPNLQGRFPLGSSSSYSLASTGGSADAIVPYHNHSMTSVLTSASVSIASTKAATGSSGISDIMRDTNGIGTLTSTDYAGTSGNLTGANMPPYVAVYVWKRTA